MKEKVQKIIDSLTLDEKVGQLLCPDVYASDDMEKVEEVFKHSHVGSIFLTSMSKEKVQEFKKIAQKYSPLPVMISADVECGPGWVVDGLPTMPYPMAWGATDDEELIYKTGVETGISCRANDISWTFSPVIDINYNPLNPVTNIRAVSDSPDQVIKISSAYIKGMQENNNLIACCKHFPGDGVDDKNQHFVTSVNSFSKEQWDATYGKVFKSMIDLGVQSFMVGHIALPCYDSYEDEHGFMPASLSYELKTNLLKKELGFDGVLVSDAMSMLGACTRVKREKLGVEFIKTGGDVVLFPLPEDFDNIKQAVLSGEISEERFNDALERVIKMKIKAGLFDGDRTFDNLEEIESSMEKHCNEIADKSIKVVRNFKNIIPVNKKDVKTALVINVYETLKFGTPPANVMQEELEKRGIKADTVTNPDHKDVDEMIKNYDMVIVALYYGGSCPGVYGSCNKMGWDAIMTFWCGFILKAKNLVFVSMGDPYKLQEIPFVDTYVNAFSNADSSKRAVIKAVLGEIECTAKNPVDFGKYFKRETI